MKYVNLESEGQIYFLLEPDLRLLKVGFSTCVPYRIATLQKRYRRSPFILLGTRGGTQRDERALHKSLAAWRYVGEWYDFNDSLYSFLSEGDR